MRKLVRKVIVDSISPIEGADRIELAHIGGWQCVVPKGQFKAGDVGVYFEIDSALPADDPRYEFLKKSSYKEFKDDNGNVLEACVRIRTQEFRKKLSQGLLMPVGDFPEIVDAELGADCAEVLHVQHYDHIASKYIKCEDAKGLLPGWIPSTELERIQNLSNYFDEKKGMEFEVTRKIDGQSMTVFYAPEYRANDPFGVCSHELEFKLDSDSLFVKLANQLGLREKLEQHYKETGIELAIQGELHGLGIQKNRDKLTDVQFRVYSIYNITKQMYLSPDERHEWCEKYGVPHVPVIARHFKPFDTFKDTDELLAYSDGLTENGNPREGLVYKQEESSLKPILFKAVSNKYLLKGEK
jgi:RNA ligase (TIGR02306 family)